MNATSRRRDRGAVIPIVAILLPVLMVMTAFAIDLGRQRALRRDLQADADVIALDLVRLADGRTTSAIESDPGYVTFVNQSFVANGIEPVATVAELAGVVTFGTWDASTNPAFDETGDPPNAVRVVLDGTLDYYFQPGNGSARRTGYAVRQGQGVFSIGSRLASFDSADADLIDPILDALFQGLGPVAPVSTQHAVLFDMPWSLASLQQTPPSSVSLDALSYEGLAGGNVATGEVMGYAYQELLAAGTDVGSPEQVLTTDISAATLLVATASALDASGDGPEVDAAVAYLGSLAASADPGLTINVGDLLGASASEPGAVMASNVNAWDMVMLGAQLANAQNLVGTSLTVPPTVTQGIPLIQNVASSSASATVGVIEGPQLGRGRPGDATAVASTSQIRVGTTVDMTVDVNISSFLPPLSPLPSVARVEFQLPVSATVADATAALVGLDCNIPDPSLSTLDLDTTTDAAHVRIGSIPAGEELVSVGEEDPAALTRLAKVFIGGGSVAEIDGGANAPIGSPATTPVTGLPVGQSDTVEAGPLGLQGQTTLTARLLGTAIGDPLMASIINSIISEVIRPLIENIDAYLVDPLLDALGVGTAEADVSALGASCDSPMLVG